MAQVHCGDVILDLCQMSHLVHVYKLAGSNIQIHFVFNSVKSIGSQMDQVTFTSAFEHWVAEYQMERNKTERKPTPVPSESSVPFLFFFKILDLHFYKYLFIYFLNFI
jgi:hypothetical protein